MNDTLKAALWTFAQAFLAVFIPGLFGFLDEILELASTRQIGNWSVTLDAFVALLVGALAAGWAVLKQFVVARWFPKQKATYKA